MLVVFANVQIHVQDGADVPLCVQLIERLDAALQAQRNAAATQALYAALLQQKNPTTGGPQ